MPVVTSSLIGPAAAAAAGATVRFDLVDAGGQPLEQGWLAATNKTIIGTSEVNADAAGAYTITVPANADITPAGTRWRRRIFPADGGRAITALLVVPSGAGPYNEDDLAVAPVPGLVEPPVRGQLAYVRLSGAPNTTLDTTSLTLEAIPGLETTFNARGRPVAVRAIASHAYTSGEPVGQRFQIHIDGTPAGPARDIVGTTIQYMLIDTTVTPTVGEHTIDVRRLVTVAGTGKIIPQSYFGIPCEVSIEVVER